jgi:hypothetical protein
MNREDLLRRGELNIADATFVREHFIPVALELKRWNIVVFEAFRAIELLMKGMICLSGHAPRQSHEIHFLVDDFLRLLATDGNSQPFLYSAASPSGHAYGIYWDGTSIQLLKKVAGLYTLLGSTPTEEVPIDRLLRLRLDVDGSKVSIYCGGELILQTTDSSISDPIRFSRSFERAPDLGRVHRLKDAAERLRATREDAYFGTVLFSKQNAEEAVTLMNSALREAGVFVTLTD